MKTNRHSRIVIALLAVVILIACNGKTLQLKPEEEPNRAYYEHLLMHSQAVQKFAEAAMKYNLHFDAADPATQDVLVKEVDPLWLKASDALDAWEVAIKAGKTGESEIEAYKRIKTQILLAVPDLLWGE